MNQVNHQLTSREGINTHRFEPVSHNELMLVSGGGIFGRIFDKVVKWVKDKICGCKK
jgi:hypothetical protein